MASVIRMTKWQIMVKGIKYIQLESGAYPRDAEWLSMSDCERGIYHSLITFIACEEGKLTFNAENLSYLCNTSVEKFNSFWKKYSHKFIEKDGIISHKRVNEEIKKARKSWNQKRLAGLASAKARSTAVETNVGTAVGTAAQQIKVKVKDKIKEKINYLLNFNKSYKKTFSWFESEFDLQTTRERNTFIKYAKLYAGLGEYDKNFNYRMADKLLDMKKDASDSISLKKMFIAGMNNEIEKMELPNATS